MDINQQMHSNFKKIFYVFRLIKVSLKVARKNYRKTRKTRINEMHFWQKR